MKQAFMREDPFCLN